MFWYQKLPNPTCLFRPVAQGWFATNCTSSSGQVILCLGSSAFPLQSKGIKCCMDLLGSMCLLPSPQHYHERKEREKGEWKE